MSDGAAATLWAAVITALVGAAVFLAGEIIKLVRGSRERRAAVIDDVLRALSDVVASATRPKISLRWSNKPIRYMTSVLALFPILPKRDLVVVDWLLDHTQRLGKATTGEEIGELVGEAQSQLMVWMRYPSMGRTLMIKDLEARGVESPIAAVMKLKPGR
ncbi:MAG: hypothetical protein AAGC66_04545 [Leifsonia sp.]